MTMWQTLVAGGILAGTVLVHASNPLATEDQHHIDELSKSFLGRGNLDALKQKAREPVSYTHLTLPTKRIV